MGYVRVAAVAPIVAIGNPLRNAEEILRWLEDTRLAGASLIAFPELSISGYTSEDLFFNQDMLDQCEQAIAQIAAAAGVQVVIVGAPLQLYDGRLLNAAFVCQHGRVIGVVPKVSNPNYGEFYDKRWFVSGAGIDSFIDHPVLGRFKVSTSQLFLLGETRFAVEICEDLWQPLPPSSYHVLAGAELIVNLSASNELVAKSEYRRDLVRMASAQGICAYLYTSAGPTESTRDIVFGSHLMLAENGAVLVESERFDFSGTHLIGEFDWQKLRHDRIKNNTFAAAARPENYTIAGDSAGAVLDTLNRHYLCHPFVPDDEDGLSARASEIFRIQATGLARRVMASHAKTLVLGVSGGLDSTLALLVCLDALAMLNSAEIKLLPVTMPGPASSAHTIETAHRLANAANTSLEVIAIDKAVSQHLADISHGGDFDVVFENAQARERTQILFDLANKSGGIVIGTGDLSELALGWCTYNADHMSSYNVNVSVPKTLVKYLCRWHARHRASTALADALVRVLDTPVSPELVPSDDGEIAQETESIIGPYELHDFFIYHYLRNGFSARKIYILAVRSFTGKYGNTEIKQWLEVFYRRFYTQQFKRSTLPAGPKIGSVSLSPRGDWRMPDEADVSAIVAQIKQF
ncbi:NAD(+) synthase [Chromatiales bacterium (ex Bugula neritina AB1)]|nr:NAD(+) synthase [Chromatiales bacterium (ex Bugula neritina AB1)]